MISLIMLKLFALAELWIPTNEPDDDRENNRSLFA